MHKLKNGSYFPYKMIRGKVFSIDRILEKRINPPLNTLSQRRRNRDGKKNTQNIDNNVYGTTTMCHGRFGFIV